MAEGTLVPAWSDRLAAWLAANRQKLLVALTLSVASEFVAWAVAAAYGYWSRGAALGLRSYCLWDCGWYAGIVRAGYAAAPAEHRAGDAANWAFFPLHPLLAGAVHRLTGLTPEESLLVVGSLLLPVAIFLFIALLEAHEIDLDPWLAGLLVAFNPESLYAHTGYTEPLYFALCAGALLALQRDRWLLAGLLGAAGSATRLVGAFLVVPMLARLVRPPAPAALLDRLLAIALVPLGVALFGWHLYGLSGDLLGFLHIQIAWDHVLQNPLLVWLRAIWHFGWNQLLAAAAVWGLCGALYLCLRRMVGYGLFLALATLLPLSTTVISLPRYIFWQPVFLVGLAMALSERPAVTPFLLPLFVAGNLLMSVAWLSLRIIAL